MKERAVYYCRVSTEEEHQLASIKHQKEEAEQAIRDMGWKLIEGYVDEGRSGTTTRYRTEYKRMKEDMEADRFDILVVKSQDRLMRNTREWYLFLDRLLKNQKKLYFYLERRFYSSEDALLTGIKAILAEDFSRSLSRNINHAHERRQKTGSNVVLTSATWGYEKQNRQVVVNEEEAKMIRLIFELAAENYGSRVIAERLAERGYRNRKGGRLAEQTVRRIIRNPLYKGTARMHTQHQNFETKQIEKIAKEEWIYHEGIVPALVSGELWETANQLMDSRRRGRRGQEEAWKHKTDSQKQKHPLSGKVHCGLCGSSYWRRTRTLTSGKKHIWSCCRFLEEGKKACQNLHLPESELEDIIKKILENRRRARIETGTRMEMRTRMETETENDTNQLEICSEIRVYPTYLEVNLQNPKSIEYSEHTEYSNYIKYSKPMKHSEYMKYLEPIRVEIHFLSSRKREYQICL